MASSAHFIGLMSGTSTDGVDAVLADFSDKTPRIKAECSLPMPAALRSEFLALNRPGHNELTRAALAGNELATLYARASKQVLAQAGLAPDDVAAIGAHGQTVRHAPERGFTLQINNSALLAELTGIAVIADFRTRDVAAGGQGAPLVPGFHEAVFSCEHPRVVLNLGGIGNVTVLQPGLAVRGFDTGPANALLDLWCQQHTGAAYDDRGLWAASGRTIPELLRVLIQSEPWFALPPPKSTGRDLFNARWLEQRLASFLPEHFAAKDIQASLQSLTVHTVANAISAWAPDTQDILVCGGGAQNAGLMGELASVTQLTVRPTSELGIPTQIVEALAFAWLAWAHEHGRPAGLPAVTGARHANVLGCKYPA